MAQKKTAPTDEELSAMFEGIGDDDDDALAGSVTLDPTTSAHHNATATATNTTTTATSSKKVTPASTEADDDDPLAELANLAAAPRLSTSSRPNTPNRFAGGPPAAVSRKTDIYTPSSTTPSARSSEEKAQAVDPEQRVYRTAVPQQPAYQLQQQQPQPAKSGGGGGWWGGLSSLASAAVTQAQAAVKEIQKNEEAQKWAEQVKGNYGALKGMGLNEIRNKALPTFTSILHTIAPPISQHERLQVHITHDLVGYPSLDPLVYQTFSRVMAQVEGGDLLVVQRGSESAHRKLSDVAYDGGSSSGWSDGPWWRDSNPPRSMNAVKGLAEGTKLVRVGAESYSAEFYNAHGGLEDAAQRATMELSKDNPVRSSDIFLAIQVITYTAAADHFSSGASAKETESIVVDESETPDELLAFAVYLHDPIHNIAFSTLSQAIPQKWSEWLDAQADVVIDDGVALPAAIVEIIESGGVDPRSWVAEWVEEVIETAVGVVAQRYVARRMGVGEGGIGRGKRREMVVESGGGEAARAI